MPADKVCPAVAVPEIDGNDVTLGPFWTFTVPIWVVERTPEEETSATPSWSPPFGSVPVASW
jgi:hypothetical protein